MVKPDAVDDIQAQVIARDIAKQVEDELTYLRPDPRDGRPRIVCDRIRALMSMRQ